MQYGLLTFPLSHCEFCSIAKTSARRQLCLFNCKLEKATTTTPATPTTTAATMQHKLHVVDNVIQEGSNIGFIVYSNRFFI